MRTTIIATTAALALGTLAASASAKTGGAGWQSAYTFTVPTGEGEQFFHYACPTGFSAENGGFLATATTQGNGFVLSGNGPRLDLSPPSYAEWAWDFKWIAGGAPAGSTITFNVLCKKGAP